MMSMPNSDIEVELNVDGYVGLEPANGNGIELLENQHMEGHNVEMSVVDLPPTLLESAAQEVSPQQVNNSDEDRKTALKLSLVVIGVSCGGIYSIYAGLAENKGHYYKHVRMACTMLLMITLLSSVVVMGLGFNRLKKEWLIKILNRANYISLVLLTLTVLTAAMTFLLSL